MILDEPTSGLDVLVRRDFLESMVDLAGAGRTVLLSSHQIGEVERVASHIAILHRGKLMLAEPLDDLKARTFLLSVTFASRDHPAAPPEGRTLELIDAIGRPAAGALAGPRRGPLGMRDRAGASGGRIARDRNAEPRGNLHRLHAGAAAGAGASAGGSRGVIAIEGKTELPTPAGSETPMYARLWWKDARQFWPIWLVLLLAAAATQWLMLNFVRPFGAGSACSASRPCCGRASTRSLPGPRLLPASARRARSPARRLARRPAGRLGRQVFIRTRDDCHPDLRSAAHGGSEHRTLEPGTASDGIDCGRLDARSCSVALGWGLFWSSILKTALGSRAGGDDVRWG